MHKPRRITPCSRLATRSVARSGSLSCCGEFFLPAHRPRKEEKAMVPLRIISADSHVMEPPALWQERLDRKFRDQAPRVIKDETRPGYVFTSPGMTPFPAAGGFAIGKSGDELKEHLSKSYEAARPSGWDPAERMKDQDIDGVA